MTFLSLPYYSTIIIIIIIINSISLYVMSRRFLNITQCQQYLPTSFSIVTLVNLNKIDFSW